MLSIDHRVGIGSYNTLVMKAPYDGTDSFTRIVNKGAFYGENLESRYGVRIAQRLVESDQDCVALQEMNSTTFNKLLEKLSPHGFSGVYASGNIGVDEGLAFFYKTRTFFRVSQDSYYYNDGTGRGIFDIGLRLKADPNVALHVLTTHIDYRFEYATKEFEDLANISAKITGPKIVCGDFNVFPQDPRLKVLWEKQFKDVFEGKHAPTFSYGRIDYLLISPEVAGSNDSKVIGDHSKLETRDEPSDHLMIAANISLKADSRFSTPPVTKLSFQAQLKAGDQLFIRGDGNGLSWYKGVQLKNEGDGHWTFDCAAPLEEFEYKLLRNDCDWETRAKNRHFSELLTHDSAAHFS